MDGTMGIFLILISLFMAWFPVRFRRNVIVYIRWIHCVVVYAVGGDVSGEPVPGEPEGDCRHQRACRCVATLAVCCFG